eukprot:CAMPEP_0198206276 /NCGR_PEP_ID=MMETSP1445-20131203/9816_1 /TAXON_ID=36898 /ORGANISM="Pyramimonas sp., Strain CCMP2087" /LENGTH=188 /DNA_ID=CAMNT_0043878911 /DNA_START=51 /DNA_END=614 /DNA_ORIENTATION=-
MPTMASVAGPARPPSTVFTAEHAQVLSSFETAAERKGAFLVASEELAASARAAAKVLYSQAAAQLAQTGSTAASNLLPELYTDGFDAEQIWEQISLQHAPLVAKARRIIRKSQAALAAGGAEALLDIPDEIPSAEYKKARHKAKTRDDDDVLDDDDEDGDSDEDEDDLDAAIKELNEGSEDGDSDEDE